MRWAWHVAVAVEAIDRVLGRRGQWPGWVVLQKAPAESTRDMAPPLTALGMLCLHGVPGADGVLDRSREHLRLTVLPGGVWRYYANIPWDTDDTAMCALALGHHDPAVAATRDSLLAARRPDGRFLTWPTMRADDQGMDAVANAHVVGAIGPGPEVAVAVEWLAVIVADGREVASCCYYPDPLDLHMAIGRAAAAGVEGLRPAQELAAPRAVERLAGEPLSAYRRAQAILVALAGGVPAAELRTAAEDLADMQHRDGMWAPDVLYTAVSTSEFGGLSMYTSRAVTTALCAKALTMVEAT